MQQRGQQKLLLKATLFQDTYKTPHTESLYETYSWNDRSCYPNCKRCPQWVRRGVTREESNWVQAQEATAEQGGNCIILGRKATKVSQKQIKEDVSKHQRRACSTALESFRGSNPERVTGKSLFCFPSVFRENRLYHCRHPQFCQGEREVPCCRTGSEDTAPGMGFAEGQPGHSFSL